MDEKTVFFGIFGAGGHCGSGGVGAIIILKSKYNY